jgi:hypothetical protein
VDKDMQANNSKILKKLILVPALFAFLLVTGCQDVQITKKIESISPDRHWVATATTEQHSGPGTDGVIITVRLHRVGNLQPPVDILVLEETAAGPASVDVKWQGPTSLTVKYRNADLDFQAVKCGGVSISAEPA